MIHEYVEIPVIFIKLLFRHLEINNNKNNSGNKNNSDIFKFLITVRNRSTKNRIS